MSRAPEAVLMTIAAVAGADVAANAAARQSAHPITPITEFAPQVPGQPGPDVLDPQTRSCFDQQSGATSGYDSLRFTRDLDDMRGTAVVPGLGAACVGRVRVTTSITPTMEGPINIMRPNAAPAVIASGVGTVRSPLRYNAPFDSYSCLPGKGNVRRIGAIVSRRVEATGPNGELVVDGKVTVPPVSSRYMRNPTTGKILRDRHGRAILNGC